MSDDAALRLEEIDPAHWRVLVNGTIYGPYTLGQIRGFVREHRVSSSSRVSDQEEGGFKAACEHAALSALFETPGRDADVAEASNYLIVTKLDGTGRMQIMGALNRLGTFAEVMPGVWALRSTARQSRVRERLQATVTAGDQVMIANASTGRLAWLNLGPEADVHIRRVWDADIAS